MMKIIILVASMLNFRRRAFQRRKYRTVFIRAALLAGLLGQQRMGSFASATQIDDTPPPPLYPLDASSRPDEQAAIFKSAASRRSGPFQICPMVVTADDVWHS